MIYSDYANLKATAEKHAAVYQGNAPFDNIYLDNFFEPAFLENVLGEFPDIEKLKSKLHYSNPNEDKLASRGEGQFGDHTLRLVRYLNSATFLQFLQDLTGIKETLIPDPYFEGGGFHEIKPGGFLKIHVDFHRHKRMNLCRRLNLLVYLNKDWKEEYGGHFELWKKDMSECAVKILPTFNRIAIFSTTGDSWHGHPDPLNCPPDRSRKSLALYYYTNGRPENELTVKDSNRITTTFMHRKGVDQGKMQVYNAVVNKMNRLLPDPVIRSLKMIRNR